MCCADALNICKPNTKYRASADVTSVNRCLRLAICFGENKLYFTERTNVRGQQLTAWMLFRIRSNSSSYNGSVATAEHGYV